MSAKVAPNPSLTLRPICTSRSVRNREDNLILLLVAVISLVQPAISVAQNKRGPDAVTGTVTYRQRMALPPAAIVKIVLEDVSRQDAPAREISQTTFEAAGKQVPLPFRILFDRSDIDEKHTYAVRASILLNDKIIFASTQRYNVITQGAPKSVDIVLEAVAAGQGSGAKLEDAEWKLIEVGGMPAQKGGGPGANLTLHAGDKRISGSSGCNRLVGSYELSGDSLHFKPMAMTRMACQEPLMKQEQALADAFAATSGYKLVGKTLELRDGERVLARFRSGDGG
jgi:putative lipoprotein